MQTYFFKSVLLLVSALLLSACSSYTYDQQVELNTQLINIEGEALDGTPVSLPDDIIGQPAVLLFGYVHRSQFDIDRWLIGLDQTQTDVAIYELPAIKNPFARMFADNIDDSMREGIPRELWSDVITIYKDGDKVQRYTGNIKPKNARVLLVDAQAKVVYFYDRGFSVAALNELRQTLNQL
uniref:hypothetical protein n=1 Tax=Ningiella ruwaisensis TaxID=2364274 RepID=UPI00109FA715|nr:hypothetical protein [Ningiella ruwaisensis]